MKKLFIILSLILLSVYSIPLFFNSSILLYYGDSIETMYPYFVHLTQQIKSGTFVLWNYSMGFGTNNFVNFFNGLGSPFVYLASLFPETYIPYLFVFFDIVRFYFIAYFSFLWSKKLYTQESTRIIFSLLITFTGWVLHFVHFGFYLDGYMYLPLILFLSDEVLEKRKTLLFSVVISLTAFISPYFLYMHSIFLLIYQLYRYFSLNKMSLKLFFNFIQIFKFYILGILLAAFVILPEISIVLSSPRVGFDFLSNIRVDISLTRLYNFVSSFFSPVMNDYNPNLLFSRNNTLDKSIFYNYTSIFSIIALFGLLFTNFKEKKAYIILLSVMVFITFIPVTNYIMNGNDNVRWLFMLSFVVVMGVGYFMDNFVKRKFNFIYVLVVTLIFIFLILVSKNRNYIDSEFIMFDQYYFLILIILIGIYGLGIHLNNRLMILIVLSFEIILVLFFRMYSGFNERYIKSNDFKELNKVEQNIIYQNIQNSDQEFFRIDVKDAYGNDAILNNYKGFTFYSSLYNHSIRELLDERFTPNWNMSFVQSKFLLKHLFGSKYYVTDSFDEYAPFGFEKIEDNKGKSIYKQKYPTNFGYAYSNAINQSSLDNIDKSIQDFWMFNNIVTEDITFGNPGINIEPVGLIKDFQNEYVDMKNLKEGYIIVDYSKSNPYASCKIDYYKNDSLMISNQINEYGYAYIKINHDYDGFYLYCNSIHNYNEYIKSNIYYLDESSINDLYQNLSSLDSFKNVIINSNKISSSITINNDEAIVSTSVAYDVGWSIRANGVEVEPIRVNYAFLGFKLPKGSYQVEFIYYPPMFKIGLTVSILTLTSVFICYLYSLIKR